MVIVVTHTQCWFIKAYKYTVYLNKHNYTHIIFIYINMLPAFESTANESSNFYSSADKSVWQPTAHQSQPPEVKVTTNII